MLLSTLVNENESEVVQIQGYGKMTLDQAKRKAILQMEQALSEVKRNPSDSRAWKNAESLLFGSGVMKAVIQAINAQGE